MQKHTFIYFLLFTALFFWACKKRVSETLTTFSMSDTMMEKCQFYTTQKQQVKNEIRFFGKITSDNNKTAQVFPIVSGVVKNIYVELGDYVKQGQVLASIQSREVASFEKERLDAVNDVALAEKNLQVARELFAGKLNSEKDVLAAEKELEKAKTELNRVNEIYSIYNLKNGSIFNITAPISGFVISRRLNQNELIRSDISEPVFSIAEINEVWALVNINESDIGKIQLGQEVVIKTLAFPDNPCKGKIDKIFNAIDPQTKSMKARVKIPNSDFKLKPEMSCIISVQLLENHQKIVIPSSAVIFDKSKHWVMVFHDRKNIETRKIEIYREAGDITYIKSGLNEGEKIISKNGILIYDALND